MSFASLLSIALVSMLKNKMRSFLTMLGIIIGVGAVIVMVAIGAGTQKQIANQIGSLGVNLITVFPNAFRQGSVSMGGGSASRLTLEDVERITREATLLSGVSPVVRAGLQAVGGNGNWSTQALGVSEDYLSIRMWPLAAGDDITRQDVLSQAKVCVVGKTITDNLFPGEDLEAAVGRQIRLRNVPFRITGVLSPKGQTSGGNDQDDIILAPYTTVLGRLSRNKFIPQIIASASSEEDMQEAQEEMADIMRASHRIEDGEADDFFVRNQADVIETASETADFLTIFLASIAGISLLVGGIGIMNIMLVSVTERTREIGVRMAIGAKEKDILLQFLVESVAVSVSGGIIGIITGAAVSILLGILTGWVMDISPVTIAIAFVFSVLVGIFFGYYPARKASRLNPIDALRYE